MGIRISQLPEAFNISVKDDVFPILQNDITKKARIDLIKIPEYTSVYNYVNLTSAKNENYFSSLISTSSYWDNAYTQLLTNSAYWQENSNIVSEKYEYWDSVYSEVDSKFVPLSGDNLFINLTNTVLNLTGTLNLSGNFEMGDGEDTSFYIGENGNVGINTETPNTPLTVNGTISSNSVIYAKDGNSDIWNNTTSKVDDLPEGITAIKTFKDLQSVNHVVNIVKGLIVSWDQFTGGYLGGIWFDPEIWDDNLFWNETI